MELPDLVGFESDQIDWAFFQMKKPKIIIPIPMIDMNTVGVKAPVSGTGTAEGVAEAMTVGFGVAEAAGIAVGDNVCEGVASKAGTSPA